ncbi:MAG TPA: PepSY domain-containing protein [bacterium]|nr:PepSY domain-containing protein [bacterium]
MKRTICIVLAVLLLTGAGPILAAPGPKVSLEQAVKIAKGAFPVPETLSEFESNFSSYDNKPHWDLSWRTPAGSTVHGNLNVVVDAGSGDILYLYRYEDGSRPKAALPKYSRAEAEKLAREFAARIQPLYQETELVDSPADEQFWGGPLTSYRFQFERVVNGYPYADDGINVEVDANSLEVTGYRFNWNRDLTFPLPDKLINLEQAEEAFLQTGAPRLIYFRPSPEGNKERPIRLVYDLGPTASHMVDAKTGEVKPRWDYWYDPVGMGGMAQKEEARDAAMPELSPAEQAEVDEIADLLTQAEAIAKLKNVFEIPTKMKLERAHLTKSWEYTLQRQWSFSWNITDKDKGGESINASVDARSGDVLQYNYYCWSTGDEKKPKIKYKKEQLQKLAAEFLVKYQPERLEDCRLEEVEPPLIPLAEQEPQRSSIFNWVRYVNDIPFPQQGFRLEVSAETGAITSYNMIWSHHDFPTPNGVIAQADVEQKLLAGSPLVLEYLSAPQWERDYAGKPEIETGLFYHIRPQNLPSQMIDAHSGAFLDGRGDPIPDRDQALFTDLEDHPAAEAVALLAARNIVQGAPDGLFHPAEEITQPAYLVMLLRTTGYQPRGEVEAGPWYRQYEEQARRRGILTEEDNINPTAAISREQAAVWTVRALDQERVASIADIWDIPANDAAAIGYPGHVALYLGQNLDPDRQDNFRPQATLTRAQAAQGMVLFLTQERY